MGITADRDPVPAVSIDRIARDVNRRGPEDTDPITLVAADRVPHNAGSRGTPHNDSMRSIILKDVSARGLVSEGENSNPSRRVRYDQDPIKSTVF